MARNEEKAQSMLYRFREAQMAELGIGSKFRERRPTNTNMVDNVKDADRWRHDIIREISRKVAKIQDSGLSEYQIRDLNDKINRLLKEKRAWEYRIKELGGPDYRKSAPKMLGDDGKEVPGSHGYRYFGRARDLPGVKELFEVPVVEDTSKTMGELHRNVDADYYGFRDEDDGLLLEYEQELAKKELEKALAEDLAAGLEAPEGADEMVDQVPDPKNVWKREYRFVESRVPNIQQVEAWLLERKRQEILDRFLGQ